MAILYITAQLLGSIVGFGFLIFITPIQNFEVVKSFGSTIPSEGLTIWQAVLVEFLATMVLTMISCAAWDPRHARKQDAMPLKLGLAVSALSVCFVS